MRVVLSGVNLVEGGPLKVFYDAIKAFSDIDGVELICLVHDRSIFNIFDSCKVKFISFPKVKHSWLKRIFFEYIQCRFISKEIMPDIWISMHDVTPYLYEGKCIKQYVYCHNPSPFYKASFADLFFDKKFFLFSLFYRFLYAVNIHANHAVICQQRWIGSFFKTKLNVQNVIVAKPNVPVNFWSLVSNKKNDTNVITMFYPALPRTFKNFELILSAFEILDKSRLNNKSPELIITVDGAESKYARWLYRRFSHIPGVKFVGRLNREQVSEYYQLADLVLFPSKLETWGLPIVEAKEFQKPIFLADLPYAHETLGCYDKAKFIDVSDHVRLARLMEEFACGNLEFDVINESSDDGILKDWDSLARFIVSQ